MKSAFVYVMIAAVSLIGTGCSHTETLTRETLAIDTDRDIVVHTKDGRTMQFARGDYRIVETNSGSLKGKGHIIQNENSGDLRPFDGELTFQQIQDIQHTDVTTAGKITTVAILSSVAVGILLLYGLTQIKWH
ncbi:MAG TPA: hypothetical protein VES59_11440 [Bacteroidota bacterium]|nr:hypothetical protein [Bacteroidota bacterium]